MITAEFVNVKLKNDKNVNAKSESTGDYGWTHKGAKSKRKHSVYSAVYTYRLHAKPYKSIYYIYINAVNDNIIYKGIYTVLYSYIPLFI